MFDCLCEVQLLKSGITFLLPCSVQPEDSQCLLSITKKFDCGAPSFPNTYFWTGSLRG